MPETCVRLATTAASFMAALCLLAPIAHASTLADEYSALLEKVRTYVPSVEPVAEPVLMRYGPLAGATSEVRTVTRIDDSRGNGEPAYLAMSVVNFLKREEATDQMLQAVYKVRWASTYYEGPGTLSTKDNVPLGTKITYLMDGIGNTSDFQIFVPTNTDPEKVPLPGTKEYDEIIKNVSTRLLPTYPVPQGEQVYQPFLVAEGLPADGLVQGGRAPYLLGASHCGNEECLIVRIDETLATPQHTAKADNDVTMSAKALGYLVISKQTYLIKDGLIWLQSDIQTESLHVAHNTIAQMTGILTSQHFNEYQ